MIITNFYSLNDVSSYLNSKFYQYCLPINREILFCIQTGNIKDIVDYLSSNNSLSLESFSEDDFLSYIKTQHPDYDPDNQHYSPNYCFLYIGNKSSFVREVFSDIVPQLSSSFSEIVFSHCGISNDYIIFPSAHHISTSREINQLIHLNVASLDYTSYFKDISNVIKVLQNDNKFYQKHLNTLQIEVVQLRKENSDLKEQLFNKSISSWS